MGIIPERVIIESASRNRTKGAVMPFYEFECTTCGAVSEELVSMDTKEIKCPECQHAARKIISRCSFKLVGGGWYADGYASKK